MALGYGFFDSTSIVTTVNGFPVGNNARSASFFARYFSSFIGNGVLQKEDSFRVVPLANTVVQIQPGSAFVRGYFCYDDEPNSITITPDPNATGVFTLVLRLNLDDGNFSFRVGSADDNFPIRNASTYDLALARITVPAATAVLTESMITDLRADETVCGFVKSLSYSGTEKLEKEMRLSLEGGCTGEVAFDGSADKVLSVKSLNIGYVNAGVLPVKYGGTGASDASNACKSIGAAPVKHSTNPKDLEEGYIPHDTIATLGTDPFCRLRNIALVDELPISMKNGDIYLVYGQSGRGLYVVLNNAAILIASANS